MTRDQLLRPVLMAWQVELVPALDVPDLATGLIHPAGQPWQAAGPPAGQPWRLAELPGMGATLVGMLDSACRAATGQPIRLRIPTPLPDHDGLVLADLHYSASMAEAARLRAQHRGEA